MDNNGAVIMFWLILSNFHDQNLTAIVTKIVLSELNLFFRGMGGGVVALCTSQQR